MSWFCKLIPWYFYPCKCNTEQQPFPTSPLPTVHMECIIFMFMFILLWNRLKWLNLKIIFRVALHYIIFKVLKAVTFGDLCAVKDEFVAPRLIFILFPIIQRLRTERDSLKETIEELRCVQAQEGQLTTTGKKPNEIKCIFSKVYGTSMESLECTFI